MAEEGKEGANQEGASTQENQAGDQSRSQESVVAEFNRKYNKLSEENSRMSQMLEQLVAKQNQVVVSPTKAQEDEKELVDLAYSNPAEYARRVTAAARKEASQVVNSTIQQQQQTNNVLTQLASEYPELADNSSELTTKAVNIYKNMSESERNSPMSYKIAVRDAAADLGILPKKNRPKDSSNEPNIGNSNSAANEVSKAQSRAQAKSQNKLDEKTLEFAKLMGLDTSKKEVLERLTKRNERKSWGKYE